MGRAHHTRGVVDIQTHISLDHARWLTGVQPHAHTNRFGTGPGVEGEFSLRGYRGFEGIAGASKDSKHCVPLRIDLLTVIGMESGAQQGTALVQQFGVAFT
jgi:hypothetical protein